MKISRIDVFQLDIPLEKPKRYPNMTYESLDDTIVRLETDTGLVGWGEVCPIASTYQPEHALGVRAAIEEMAPGLIGEDPTQTDRINATMDRWLMGGEYAKSAIDIACWDIVGKAYGRPLYHRRSQLNGMRSCERWLDAEVSPRRMRWPMHRTNRSEVACSLTG